MRLKCFAAGIAMLLVAAAPAHAAVTDETVLLDTFEPGVKNISTPRSTNDVLPAGILYVATVKGTYSKWRAGQWSAFCGVPQSLPLISSPGANNGPAGLDAETAFATVDVPGRGCTRLPTHRRRGFQIRVNAGNFVHPEPIGGAVSVPNLNHEYSYGIIGENQAISFRVIDKPAADNYGVLSIRVRLAVTDDCANDGWRSLGFASEDACRGRFDTANGGSGNVPPPEIRGGPTDDSSGPIGGRFKISRRAVKITRGGRVVVRVSCRSPRPCRGTLRLRTATGVKSPSKKRRVKLGTTITFDIPPKTRNKLLTLTLTKAQRSLLKRLRIVPVQAIGQVALGNSVSGTVHRRFKLYREPRP